MKFRLMALMMVLFCMCGNAWGLSTERSGLIYYPTDGANLIAMHNAVVTRGLPAHYKLIHTSSGETTPYIITSGVTFQEYETFEVEDYAMIVPDSGVTVTIYIPENVEAGERQKIFDLSGGGAIAFIEDSEGSAMHFGVDTDETASNNTEYFDAAITACSLYVPVNIYEINGQIGEIPSNRFVRGAGKGKTIIKIADNSVVQGSAFTVLTTENSGTSITLSDLTIDGNLDNQAGVIPTGNANYGFAVRATNVLVENCEFTGIAANGTGVPTNGAQVIFDNCWSHHNGKKGFHSGSVSDVQIKGGFWYTNGEGAAGSYGVGIGMHQGMKDFNIIGAHCFDNGLYGIYVGDSLGESGSDSRRGNIIGCNSYDNYSAGINISADDTESGNLNIHLKIVGCDIYGQTYYGITATGAHSIIISNNSIRENGRSGVRTVNPRNIKILGNEIYNNNQEDSTYSGIDIVTAGSEPGYNDCGNVTIANNTIADHQSTATQEFGIRTNNESAWTANLKIHNNILFGNVDEQIEVAAGTYPNSKFFIQNNDGYTTRSYGQATILSGNQTETVTHGLEEAPEFISITGLNSDEVSNLRAATVGGSTFIIRAVDGNVTADRVVYWEASCETLAN